MSSVGQMVISVNNSDVHKLVDAVVGGGTVQGTGPGVSFSGGERVSCRDLAGQESEYSRVARIPRGPKPAAHTPCTKKTVHLYCSSDRLQCSFLIFRSEWKCLHKACAHICLFLTQRVNKRIRNDMVSLSSLCLKSFKVSF